MIRVLSWNVRGIGGIALLRRLLKLCKLHHISLFFIEPFISYDHVSRIASKCGFLDSVSSVNGKVLIFLVS